MIEYAAWSRGTLETWNNEADAAAGGNRRLTHMAVGRGDEPKGRSKRILRGTEKTLPERKLLRRFLSSRIGRTEAQLGDELRARFPAGWERDRAVEFLRDMLTNPRLARWGLCLKGGVLARVVWNGKEPTVLPVPESAVIAPPTRRTRGASEAKRAALEAAAWPAWRELGGEDEDEVDDDGEEESDLEEWGEEDSLDLLLAHRTLYPRLSLGEFTNGRMGDASGCDPGDEVDDGPGDGPGVVVGDAVDYTFADAAADGHYDDDYDSYDYSDPDGFDEYGGPGGGYGFDSIHYREPDDEPGDEPGDEPAHVPDDEPDDDVPSHLADHPLVMEPLPRDFMGPRRLSRRTRGPQWARHKPLKGRGVAVAPWRTERRQ